MNDLTYDRLAEIVRGNEFALARISADYEPAGGEGSKVFPPTFPATTANPSPYLFEKRVRGGDQVGAVVLDQVPSEANRVEEALAEAQAEGAITLPLIRLTHQKQTSMVMTALDLPHRLFDAYIRDSMLDGAKFDSTPLGKAVRAADLSDATVVYQHDPGTIVFGGWNSHRAGRQTKFPRQYSSDIVGWEPVEGSRRAGRMDPVNLTGSRTGEGDDWTYATVAAKGTNNRLSEIGLGNIAPNAAHGGVTISKATRFANLSLTGLKRIRFGTADRAAQDAARTLLAAYALLGDRLAFAGPSLWLRSGCELLPTGEQLSWRGRNGLVEEFTLEPDSAVTLFDRARAAADDAGLGFVLEPVELTPSKSLGEAIDFSLTKAEADD
jgi:CRISPR-associated protein Csb1